jgi:hypothetical protein
LQCYFGIIILVACRSENVTEYKEPVILSVAKDLRLPFQTAGNEFSATGR